MIAPALRDDDLLEDIAAAPEDGAVHLWWLGQSGFLLKWKREHVLIDPYLSEALTLKYAGTDRPHVRMTERPVDPAGLGFVGLALSSHLHGDHFDAETLRPLAQSAASAGARLKLILPRSGRTPAAQRMGDAQVEYLPIDAGDEVLVGSFRIKAIAAAHPTVERDESGSCRFLGYILRIGSWSLYHSGDTLWHGDLLSDLWAERPDLALLPINGHRPERGVAGNLNGTEAAALAKACGASLVIPHHYEMFEFNTESPDEFVSACSRLGQKYRLLRCGERLSSRIFSP